jgi:hypothetical protein
MTAIALLASTFVLVLTLGLQSQLVNRGHMLAAMINSFAIGTANLVLFKLAPDASGYDIAGFLLGGPFGIAASMVVYRRFFGRSPQP